jgi:hypothetical protein
MVLSQDIIDIQLAKEPSEAAQNVAGGIVAGMIFLVMGGCVFVVASANRTEQYSPAAKRYATELYQDATQDIDGLCQRGLEEIERLPESQREYAREVLDNHTEKMQSQIRSSYERFNER